MIKFEFGETWRDVKEKNYRCIKKRGIKKKFHVKWDTSVNLQNRRVMSRHNGKVGMYEL